MRLPLSVKVKKMQEDEEGEEGARGGGGCSSWRKRGRGVAKGPCAAAR
eukprot:SAG31_NODE_48918_length_163_cov_11.546875_1_plen_47_part_01